MKTPLRYPGGKTRACKKLHDVMSSFIDLSNTRLIVSPFLGGASFELFMYDKYSNLHIWGNDLFEPLYTFWKVVQDKEQQSDLCARLQAEHQNGMNKEKFMLARGPPPNNTKDGDVLLVSQAMNYFLVNRCSFSGSTLSGGYSVDSAKFRFTLSSIQRVQDLRLSTDRFCVTNMDVFTILTYIAKNEEPPHSSNEMQWQWTRDHVNHMVLFLDPPYCLGKHSRLYGKNGNLHTRFDHKRLCELLRSLSPDIHWMLTYNDCLEVRNMYSEYSIIPLEWAYGMNKTKKSSEIVILSKKKDGCL
jgi:DNA adenine methylase